MKNMSGFRPPSLLLVGCLVAFPSPLLSDTPPPTPDRVAIERVVRDYIDGWYEGNADRMARALHPDFVKRAPFPLPTGKVVLDSVTADGMIELTRAGMGKRKAQPGKGNEVIVFDVSGDLASAKSASPDYIDLLHLARINGEWRIINVLWQPLKPLASPK